MDRFEDLLHAYCERIERELEELWIKKIDPATQLNPSDVEVMDTLFHSLKSLKTVMSMMEGDKRYDSGYSGSRYPISNYSGKRDSMGRYSRDTEKENMMNNLNDMMKNVRSDDEAIAIRNAMDAVSRIK